MTTARNMLSGLFYGALLLAASCSGGSGQKTLPNEFEQDDAQELAVYMESNADSVFLSWDAPKAASFDGIRVKDAVGKNDLGLPASARSCVLTHIPANTPVKITVSVMSGSDVVTSSNVTALIDGLDTKTASLIIQDKAGVTAGDGMYSIALPDGRSIFLMGDSYTGTVTEGRRSTGDHMYRNSYNVYDPSARTAKAIVGTGNHSAAVPPGETNETKWYWPGHGFVVGNNLYIFQELMYQGAEGAWGFRYESTRALKYSLPGIELVSDDAIPYSGPDHIHFGAAALNDGDWLYVYAQVDIENDWDPVTEVYLARTTEDRLTTSWEYWDGASWSTSPSSAAALSGLSSVPVSSQFNVFRLDGKYVLLTQDKTFNSGKIYTFIADSPQGPWRNRKPVYQVPSGSLPSNWFTYNAMAHPQFEEDGRILVSYCVNTDNFSEQFSNVSCYRPRFFWVEKDTILK